MVTPRGGRPVLPRSHVHGVPPIDASKYRKRVTWRLAVSILQFAWVVLGSPPWTRLDLGTGDTFAVTVNTAGLHQIWA